VTVAALGLGDGSRTVLGDSAATDGGRALMDEDATKTPTPRSCGLTPALRVDCATRQQKFGLARARWLGDR